MTTNKSSISPHEHNFVHRPHRTFWGLAVPVLLSLIAEPVTGLVDTAFVSGLGSPALAALGIGTAVLSSVFWVFNFLGVGTQTQVAQAWGDKHNPTIEAEAQNQTETITGSGIGTGQDVQHGSGSLRGIQRAQMVYAMAMWLGLGCGIALLVVGWWIAPAGIRFMGAAGEVYDNALLYVRIRLFGAPALLIKIALFGALRGLQDMRTPLYVALVVNGLNILLDAVLIYGWGFIPPLGVAGAAIATVISQCLGLVWAMWAIIRRLGWHKHPQFREIGAFLQIGRDMFLRTGLLTLFLLLATRVANQAGVDAGAAHQVLRQTWTFAAILLDGLAIAAQSLIGFFLGAAMLKQARKVAFVVCIWSVGVGLFLTFAMLLSQDIVLRLFVPASAIGVFLPAWYLIAFNQPLNSLAFASDGIHWGTGDFRYLRNAIALATSVGLLGLLLIDPRHPNALTMIWAVTIVWIIIRGIFGILRVWPGIGRSPLNPKDPA